MKWRTDKPTAELIIAYLKGFVLPLVLTLNEEGQYIDDYYSDVCTDSIEKWADLEEDETATENNSLKEEVISYFQGYWPGTETAEQCNTDMHFTPLAIIRLAEHFAKWGAEHLKK